MKTPDQFCIPRGKNGQAWIWHLTDVRDAVQGVILALEKDEAIDEAFNIAGPEPFRWDEGVSYMCEKLGKDYCECELPNFWHFEFDLSKAEKLLGFKPEYGTKRMIDDAIAFQNGEDIGVLPPAFPH